MNKINCIVNNCSYNKSDICYSTRVNIGGKTATEECDTCCGSFLDKKLYSDLTNNVNTQCYCDCLICKVESCEHNYNNLCNLNSINVSGENAKIYSETNCASFNSK
ncbi:DUF1540 domain-containing protein [Clostridium gasigenes]|uniref:DUF1540 domain-containing protein n=1 Tax=Clostridium gasigenes TaxID=94869 RepID=UPI001C0AD28B|nr:DUF1540 domain-containing protein [Clostridium gasigenes]MBU3131539.1 DUF1540 domain-containing protein [Clostridium gasigenes]